MKRGLHQECGCVHSLCERLIEECPVGGAGPIDCRGMPTKMVLQQKNRHHEFETWQPGTSEGRCLEGKEED